MRIWEPVETAVVLGASGRIDEDVKRDVCRRDGVSIGRRSSGGGTVVIGPGAINFTVVLPDTAAPGLKAVDRAQGYVLGRVARASANQGVPVEVLGSGDLTLGGRKFSGSAQRRLRTHFLVHATILHQFPIDRVERYLNPPRRQPEYRAGRSHLDFLINLDRPRSLLIDAIRSAWLPPSDRLAPSAGSVPVDLVASLVRSKFDDPAWIERL